jgi:hypothetical protein
VLYIGIGLAYRSQGLCVGTVGCGCNIRSKALGRVTLVDAVDAFRVLLLITTGVVSREVMIVDI